MNELIKITYDNDRPTVSARELHEFLGVDTEYRHWFPRMCEYGFSEGLDFNPVIFDRVQNEGKRVVTRKVDDAQLTIDMAKEVCMLQRNDKGKLARQYFIQLEKDWNSPEKVMARALRIADEKIRLLSIENSKQKQIIGELKPLADYTDMILKNKGLVTTNQIAKDYTIKGWVMDDERLKNGGSVLTTEYFDRLLEQIREIRLSERRFYQKITDIYATALDYDRTAKTTKQFFAKVQNKMHYAVHGHTAAELIYERADAEKPHMGLTTWAAAPEGKIVKSDVTMRSLERIVSAYLDLAEDRAERHIPMTMEDWSKRLDLFLMADDREILQDAGKITAEIAKAKAETEFEKYRIVQDRLFMSDFDRYMLELENYIQK